MKHRKRGSRPSGVLLPEIFAIPASFDMKDYIARAAAKQAEKNGERFLSSSEYARRKLLPKNWREQLAEWRTEEVR